MACGWGRGRMAGTHNGGVGGGVVGGWGAVSPPQAPHPAPSHALTPRVRLTVHAPYKSYVYASTLGAAETPWPERGRASACGGDSEKNNATNFK
jgi:hypothetical protein